MTKIDSRKIVDTIKFIEEAHQRKVGTGVAFRKFSTGQTVPFFIHCIWCATMLLLEKDLPEEMRYNGALALLCHDVLEDTTAKLPKSLPKKVVNLINDMTYRGGFEEEKSKVLKKHPMIHLLKLYDKTATLYDSADSPVLKDVYPEWIKFTKKLIQSVEKNYGILRITKLARLLVEE